MNVVNLFLCHADAIFSYMLSISTNWYIQWCATFTLFCSPPHHYLCSVNYAHIDLILLNQGSLISEGSNIFLFDITVILVAVKNKLLQFVVVFEVRIYDSWFAIYNILTSLQNQVESVFLCMLIICTWICCSVWRTNLIVQM